MSALTVVRAGPLTTVQDLGRPGLAHLGVPRSGALDVPALRLANRLVGNDEGAAGLECTLLGVTLRADMTLRIAVTGAVATVTVDGATVPSGVVVEVPAGAVVAIGPARSGVRSYLAAGGGLAVDPVLGSRSTDTLSGLGPAPLRTGDMLPVGVVGPPADPAADTLSIVDDERPVPARDIAVRVHPGPRIGWFTDAARLFAEEYTVSATSNRVGARLTGPALDRSVPDELPSEGLVLGAVQVPASGQPLIFLADHPTTGGYPVIAVVDPADIPLLAQARPGSTLRFHPVL